jgi:hypothetical protein
VCFAVVDVVGCCDGCCDGTAAGAAKGFVGEIGAGTIG